jgi:hypothetical protein
MRQLIEGLLDSLLAHVRRFFSVGLFSPTSRAAEAGIDKLQPEKVQPFGNAFHPPMIRALSWSAHPTISLRPQASLAAYAWICEVSCCIDFLDVRPVLTSIRRFFVPQVFYWKHKPLWKYFPKPTPTDETTVVLDTTMHLL